MKIYEAGHHMESTLLEKMKMYEASMFSKKDKNFNKIYSQPQKEEGVVVVLIDNTNRYWAEQISQSGGWMWNHLAKDVEEILQSDVLDLHQKAENVQRN
eukprot:10596686-Ditylum_brightwellii.AAC.1